MMAVTDITRMPIVPQKPGRLRALWSSFLGALGAVAGLAPHVLHHVGFLAGSALVAGAGGTALFGIIGLAASVPFLLRLRRRFQSWWAPAIGLFVFTVMFSVSAFIIGPAFSDSDDAPSSPEPATDQHTDHH
jgi:membrane associated rhomboid family serine protease